MAREVTPEQIEMLDAMVAPPPAGAPSPPLSPRTQSATDQLKPGS